MRSAVCRLRCQDARGPSGVSDQSLLLISAAISEVDTEKRKKIAGDALTDIHKFSDRLIPYFKNYIGITSDKVQGFTPPKFGTVDIRGVWLSG